MAPSRVGSIDWPPHEFGLLQSLNPEEEREAKRIKYVFAYHGQSCHNNIVRSDEIERRIELDRQEMKKRRPQAKLLLLGMYSPRCLGMFQC